MRFKVKKSRGKWRSECERLHLSDDMPLPESNDICMPIGAAIRPLLKKYGLQDAVVAEKLFSVWVEAVGEDIAKHAKPISLQAGVLTVGVDSSVWLSELSRYGARRILDKLSKLTEVFTLKDIRFKIHNF